MGVTVRAGTCHRPSSGGGGWGGATSLGLHTVGRGAASSGNAPVAVGRQICHEIVRF